MKLPSFALVLLLTSCNTPPKEAIVPTSPLPSVYDGPDYERRIFYPMIPAIKWPQDLIPQ